jgi:ABC-2 type transport system permease protein
MLYLARVREFVRQPTRLFWVYGFPTVVAVCLGLAFDGRRPTDIQVDLVRNAASPPIEKILIDHGAEAKRNHQAGFLLKVVSETEADRRLRTGKTPLVVVASVSGPTTYKYDPARPESNTARATVDDVLQRAHGRIDPLATKDVTAQEPGSRYIDFLIPGLIGLNAMSGGLFGIGFVVVSFRTAKLLKCFVATPMPRRNFLLALVGARLTFLIPDVAILLTLGTVVFKMPIRGSLALVILVAIVGALAFAGIGLLISSRANSIEAINGLMNLVMLPMWLFSGVFFSSERFPHVLQPFIQALPLTQLLIALRGVMLEGMGLLQIAPALAILAAWTIGTFLLAHRLFRWT